MTTQGQVRRRVEDTLFAFDGGDDSSSGGSDTDSDDETVANEVAGSHGLLPTVVEDKPGRRY